MPQPAFLRWLVPVEQFVVNPELAGEEGVELGRHDGILIDADFPAPPDGYAYVAETVDGWATLIGIRYLWVRAHLTAELMTHPTIEDDLDPTAAEKREAQELFIKGSAAADVVLARFLDLASFRQGRFLTRLQRPLHEVEPKLFLGVPPKQAKARRDQAPQLIGTGSGPGLTLSDAGAIARAITESQTPDLGWQLYAKAMQLMTLEVNYRQAILEAAIAVEVALDSAYLRVASIEPTIAPIVKLLIRNLRSIDDQLKDGAAAVLGQSFAAEDPKHYEQVRALMTERNRIVHDGAPGPTDRLDVQRKLEAVLALLKWFEQLFQSP